MAAGLVTAGCSVSTTLQSESTEVAVGPTTTPPPAAASTNPQPTPLPPEPAADPTVQLVPQDPPASVDPTLLHGVSPDGRYGFASVDSPWADPRSCDSEPEETLAGIDIEASQPERILLFNPGLFEAANVRQMDFSQGGRAAVLFSCGATESHVWLKVVEFDELGHVAGVGPRIDVGSASSVEAPFLLGWKDEDSIRLDFFVQNDSDDQQTWQFEEQLIAADSGAVLSVELSTYSDGSSRINRHGVTTPDGHFTYREVQDPTGSTGCEGFGVAVTIEVDDGSEQRIAFRDDSQVFSSISTVQFGPGDLILWTSGCEGYISAHVGRIAADGRIVDGHLVDLYAIEAVDTAYVEYQHYRLTNDGLVVVLGGRYDGEAPGELALMRYDLSTDPQFVVTADPTLRIDVDNPLAPTMSGEGNWYLGESRVAEPACGGTTVYGDTADGFARAFPIGLELDRVVDFDVSQTRTVDFDDGYSYTTRAVVLSTECPGEYGGRRLWFGSEPERVRHGMWLERVDWPEVADVLGVREVQHDDGFSWDVLAEVVMLDGSIIEIELTAVPFG